MELRTIRDMKQPLVVDWPQTCPFERMQVRKQLSDFPKVEAGVP